MAALGLKAATNAAICSSTLAAWASGWSHMWRLERLAQ
jgi:hypothetical protein